ncbi:hypothetical protein ES319_D03G146600v1 [Gossypium barbadense]|uniref:Uncharacterized protein n=2 Tax=Gossypium TaxID=3633 RepID=A0A5J5S4H3_GOSBA|nr:hypothetical protein ES319_D03G146600v1 [Gossypium barbadense]TYG76979.1 hypothetical protein ES288_D03G158000v1 [Gossypium darwinii]
MHTDISTTVTLKRGKKERTTFILTEAEITKGKHEGSEFRTSKICCYKEKQSHQHFLTHKCKALKCIDTSLGWIVDDIFSASCRVSSGDSVAAVPLGDALLQNIEEMPQLLVDKLPPK